MLDAKRVREEPEAVRAAMSDRGASWDVDAWIALDEERRGLIAEVETLQARRNEASKQIGELMKDGARREAESLKAEVRSINDEIDGLEAQLDRASRREVARPAADRPEPAARSACRSGPTRPTTSRSGAGATPRGVRLRAQGALGPRPRARHHRLRARGQAREVALRAPRRRGRAARARAHQLHARHAHRRAATRSGGRPSLANAETLTGTGQLPKFEDDLFKTRRGRSTSSRPPRCSSPTSTATRSSRPTSCRCATCAYTPCFREEAGAAGRDTRGMIRVHQFDKVELVKFATPETSLRRARERWSPTPRTSCSSSACPYRVIVLCTGDMGFSAAKTYDLEVWLPSYDGYKEISSLLELRRLPGAPRVDQVPRPRRRSRARASCTRSTARGLAVGRDGRRDPRELPAAPTARSSCPRRCGPTWAASRSSGPRRRPRPLGGGPRGRYLRRQRARGR